jgi:RNA polymerase sigma factor (TIGR02999 family)
MNASQETTATQLLVRVRAGDRAAFDELVSIVYQELRNLARIQRRRWRGDDTLDTTALVHEAYLKLAAQGEPGWESRAHFGRVAARAMRQILINYSLARRTAKRGGERVRVSFGKLRMAGSSGEVSAEHADTLIALDEALRKLSEIDERQSQIVECRFFGGMSIPDTAEALGASPATVKRGWAMAKAWLYREMQ